MEKRYKKFIDIKTKNHVIYYSLITKEEAIKKGMDIKTLEEEDRTITELSSKQRPEKEIYYLVEWSNKPKYYYYKKTQAK